MIGAAVAAWRQRAGKARTLIQVMAGPGARAEGRPVYNQTSLKMKHLLSAALLCVAATAAAAPALAQSAGDMTLSFGIGHVDPKSDNGTLASAATTIGSNTRPTIAFEYFVRGNIGIEVLGALPFKHSVAIAGIGNAVTKHLPPTVSVNYHFPTGGKITPFVGVGINYTTFFEEESSLGQVEIDDSWGLAATLGADYALSDRRALRAELRYIDIDADVKLNGSQIGTVEIDPLVANIAYVVKF